MRSFACLAPLVAVLLLSHNAFAFENLDFERAMPIMTEDGFEVCCGQPIVATLPHWQAFSLNGFDFNVPANPPLEFGYHNAVHIGGQPAIFNIFDGGGGSVAPELFFDSPISGNYSLQLDGRSSGGELSQVGMVPDNTRSIRFLGDLRNVFELPELGPVERPISEIEVFLGDTKLQVLELEQFATHNAYGANIPAALAGTEAELRFLVPPVVESLALTLDDIRFSPIPVPEPSTLHLIGFVSWLLLNSLQVRRGVHTIG